MNFEPWPEARVAQLRKLLNEGMSASQAARALSLDGFVATRNSVIGKAHRLKQSLNGAPTPKRWSARAEEILRKHWDTSTAAQMMVLLSEIGLDFTESAVRCRASKLFGVTKGKGSPGRKRNSVSRPRIYEAPAVPPEARMVGMLDLGARDCRFPLGDPRHSDFGFCGAPKDGARSYCRYHHQLAYQPDSTMRGSQQKSLARYTVDRPFVSGMAL
jgi:GcrA cell cycle regulator